MYYISLWMLYIIVLVLCLLQKEEVTSRQPAITLEHIRNVKLRTTAEDDRYRVKVMLLYIVENGVSIYVYM